MTTSLTQVNVTTLLDKDVILMEEQVAHMTEIQQQTAEWDDFLEEIAMLKNRIIRMEERARGQRDGTTNLAGETISTMTSSRELQPPQQDPNDLVVEYSIPEWVVDTIMAKVEQQDFIMSCLGSICYPATIWLPGCVTHNRSQTRELLLRGRNRQDVDNAKEAIYNFAIDIMRENIPNLRPDLSLCGPHDNENDTAAPTPTISDDEEDFDALLNLPPMKLEGLDIMDDSKIPHAMTEIDMMGNIIIMHENVVATHTQGLHISVNEDETYKEEGADKTHSVHNIESGSRMARGTSKPPRTTTIDVTRLTIREMKEEDTVTEEELPADDEVLAKYAYEGKPNVQDDINTRDVYKLPPLVELPADSKVVTNYECGEEPEVPNMPQEKKLPADNEALPGYKYPHCRGTVTSQTEILDVAKKRNEDEPADLDREEPTVREDHLTEEELPDEDEVLAKYGYVTIKPPQEELPTDKYENSNSTNVMTRKRETLNVTRMLTCIDETTQKRGTSPMSEGGRWGHS